MKKSRKQIIKNYTIEGNEKGVGARPKKTGLMPSCRDGQMLLVVAADPQKSITLGVDAKTVDIKINAYRLTRKNGKKTLLLRISEI